MEAKKKPSVPFIDICAYVECSNNRQEVSLYCFPKKGNPLCDEWLSRVCNPALKHYSSSTLRRMGVCEEHFTPESFKPPLRSYPNGRKKLKRNAIPEPSDHLVEMWKQKLKEFMAAKQKKRDHNIEEKQKTKEGKGREEEEEEKEQQQHQQETRKEEKQQQRKKLGIEEQQQRRKEPGKEEQQQQRKKLEIEEQQRRRKEPGKEEQQQQRKKLGIEDQQQQRKESGKEEQQQQWKKPWIEEQQQQQQEMGKKAWQETRPVIEEQEIEIEMHVNKPTRVYTKQSFSFSDDEDDGMEWAEDEPAPNYVALGESSLKKSPSEMKLERENVKLKTENKYLKIQLKYLKRRLQRSLISRDRLSNELRKISK